MLGIDNNVTLLNPDPQGESKIINPEITSTIKKPESLPRLSFPRRWESMQGVNDVDVPHLGPVLQGESKLESFPDITIN
jgi:hypothetical protein